MNIKSKLNLEEVKTNIKKATDEVDQFLEKNREAVVSSAVNQIDELLLRASKQGHRVASIGALDSPIEDLGYTCYINDIKKIYLEIGYVIDISNDMNYVYVIRPTGTEI